MRELHKGICSLHTEGRFLATKVMQVGYYLQPPRVDALDFTRRSKHCQEFADVSCTTHDNLHSLSSYWPFTMWGMDIFGPLPKAAGAVKYLLVAIEYFTKWMEARPLREIMANKVEKFTWKHLI